MIDKYAEEFIPLICSATTVMLQWAGWLYVPWPRFWKRLSLFSNGIVLVAARPSITLCVSWAAVKLLRMQLISVGGIDSAEKVAILLCENSSLTHVLTSDLLSCVLSLMHV